MTEPCDLSAVEARRLIGNKQLSPVELLESCIRRVEQTNPAVNSMVAMDADVARAAAANAEQAVMQGEPLGLLHGLPLGIKDLEATAGLRTTWGSEIYKDHVPDQDDDSVANLRDEGGIILGKTNTPEFGAGANTRNAVYGATCNPFDTEKTCGGSSGGSAVALATGQVPLATGTDYAGSCRTPAAFCGIAGMRPSPGTIPFTNWPSMLTPFGVLGPLARCVDDVHLLLRAQLDVDKRDIFSSDDAMRIPEQLDAIDLGSITAALSPDLGQCPIDDGIRRTFSERTAIFANAFASADEAEPDLENIHDVFEVFRCLDFLAAFSERYDNHRDKLGPNVTDNVERGLNLTAKQIAWAQVEHATLARRFITFFDDFDVLICPTTAVSPFPHSQWYAAEINGQPMPNYTRWMSIAYALTMVVPAVVALPCGLDHEGMPFGIQVVGPNGSDALVLEVAKSLESVLAANPATSRPIPDLATLSR
jgi:amidase